MVRPYLLRRASAANEQDTTPENVMGDYSKIIRGALVAQASACGG
jgi:hypothetical protein